MLKIENYPKKALFLPFGLSFDLILNFQKKWQA
jgi:hypothetical protein